MRLNKIFIFFFLIYYSCETNKARYPINYKMINESESKNFKQNILFQNNLVDSYIENNPTYEYLNSKTGFYYYYLFKSNNKNINPTIGDKITFNYSVKDLNNNIIYSKEDIGEQNYIMDKQELLTGIREALKILKQGDIAVFIFPSYKAYGMYGDYNKIPPNTPIICSIEVKSIISHNK